MRKRPQQRRWGRDRDLGLFGEPGGSGDLNGKWIDRFHDRKGLEYLPDHTQILNLLVQNITMVAIK